MEEESKRRYESPCKLSTANPRLDCSSIENDVVLLNETIPEVIISDNSYDSNTNPEDHCDIPEGAGVTQTDSNSVKTIKSKNQLSSDEEQLIDLVVIDDDLNDSSRQIDVKHVKQEPNWLPSDNRQNHELVKDVKPLGRNFPVKSEFNEHTDDTKKINSTNNPADINISLSDPALLIHCAIRQSLSNETFVLQLDTSDALDSYLDKTVDEKPAAKKNKLGESYDMKENVVSSVTKASETEKVCDSLILTADDELETEMSLAEKNGKTQDNKPILVKPKTESFEGDANCDDKASGLKNTSTELPAVTDKILSEKEMNKSSAVVSEKSVDTKTNDVKASNGSVNTSRTLWVSNITQSIRATDLKKYISKIGKVITAKVVTDGKKCYGYVVMDNSEDASRCLKTLNNAYFEGKKITLSLTRPQKSVPDKPKDSSQSNTTSNETDETKACKPKDAREDLKKRYRSPTKSHSSRSNKRRSPNDPLTTKFDNGRRERSNSKRQSRSKEYMREKERDRLKRRFLEEQRRNRDEILRQIHREEKHREMEFKLDQERRKLQLERELFEKERRELTRLDAERRKIEKERMEVLQQRSKLQEEIQKSRMKRNADEFNVSSAIGKPQEPIKTYEKRNEISKSMEIDYRKSSSTNHPYQKTINDARDDRKNAHALKSSTASTIHRVSQKSERIDFKSGKDIAKSSKTYERSVPPPPPKIDDFELSSGRKPKHSDRKHEYSDGKSYGDRKPDRGGRKIEVIAGKYYPERSTEGSERKQERIYKKPEFEERKPHLFSERKYEYGRDSKRYRDDSYPERDNTQRTQWPASVNYTDPWKGVQPGPVSGSSGVRYQEPNFPAAPYGGGPSRIPPFYYPPTAATPEYPRYDHCSQVNGRKYN